MQPRDTRGIPSATEPSGGSATARTMAASYTQEVGDDDDDGVGVLFRVFFIFL